MKKLTIFSLAILTLTIGCDNVPAQNYGYENDQDQYDQDQYGQDQYDQDQNNYSNQNSSQQVGYQQASQSQNNGGDQLTQHIIRNKKTGQTTCSLPVPSSWKYIDNAAPGQPGITGPDGLTITEIPLEMYEYSEDPNMYQWLQQNGKKMAPPAGIENVMNQRIIPTMRQKGMTLVNQYAMPQLVEKDIAFGRQFAYSNPRNKTQAIGSDWIDRAGNKIFVDLIYFEVWGPMDVSWFYGSSMLTANQASYEKAKRQFIYALSNKTMNQDIVINSNNQYAAQQNQLNSSNSHFQAMQNIRNKGVSDRAKLSAETSAHIQNNQMESFYYKMQSNDAVLQQESNYLNNTNTVVNPYNGTEYQVESGANTYWMDNEGNYIGSDDANYDPNKYEDYPGTWQEAPNKVYK